MKIFFKIVMILQAIFFISIPILSYNGMNYDNSIGLRLISIASILLVTILIYLTLKEKEVQERGVIVMCLVINIMLMVTL